MLDNKTRLNASIRQNIVDKALETSGLNAEAKALIDARAELARDVLSECHRICGTNDADLSAKYTELMGVAETGWGKFIGLNLRRESRYYGDVDVYINGMSLTLYLNGSHAFTTKEGNRISYTTGYKTHIEMKSVSEGGPWLPYTRVSMANDSFCDRLNALEAEQESLNRKTENLKATVNAAVRQVNTVGNLLKAWPEAAELLPAEYKLSTGTGIALAPAALNALCGIPSEEKPE